jgi:hypothetical protein
VLALSDGCQLSIYLVYALGLPGDGVVKQHGVCVLLMVVAHVANRVQQAQLEIGLLTG